MNKSNIINITISIGLIITIGLLAGYALGYYRAKRSHFPEIRFTEEINEGVATIKLMEVRNGKLYGEIDGRNARIAYNPNDIIELKAGEKFEIPLANINLKTYYQANSIPQDTQFIASKNGKYYYSVFDKRALNIITANRIYFSSSADAEKTGYIKK